MSLHQLGVGECLRPGQRNLAADELVGEQRLGRDGGDVAVDDRRGRCRRVRPADHVAGPDLRRPHAEEVGDEHRWAQAHPLQTGVDGELLDLLVAVAAEARRLAREVVVGVDGRQRNEARDAFAARLTHERLEFVAECAGVEEHRRGAGQPSAAVPTDLDAVRESARCPAAG